MCRKSEAEFKWKRSNDLKKEEEDIYKDCSEKSRYHGPRNHAQG